MSDGIGLRDVIGLADLNMKIREQKKQDAFEKEAKAHLRGFQELGEDYAPEGEHDARAYHMAQIDHISGLLKREDLKKAIHERTKRDIDMQHEVILENTKKAEGLLAVGNVDQALDFYESAYDSFVDGSDMELDRKNNRLIFHNMDGTTETKEFKSQDEMITHMRSMAEQFSDKTKFAQLALSERMKINAYNADRWAQPLTYTNKDGDTIRAITKLRDPMTGKPFQKEEMGITDGNLFYHPATKKMLTAQDVLRGGYMTMEELKAFRAAQKLEAEAKSTKSAASMSTQEKLANAYVKAYNISFTKAMDMVREEEGRKDLLKALSEAMITYDLDTEEGIEKFKQVRKELLSEFVPEPPAPPLTTKESKKVKGVARGLVADVRGKKEKAELPEGVTEEDLQFTMKKHGLSREEVIARITK